MSTTGSLSLRWSRPLADYARSPTWSADGAFVAAVDASGGVWAGQTDHGTPTLIAARAHPGGALAAAFHPEAPRLATGGHDGGCKLWSLPAGRCDAEVPIGRAWVEHLAWSPCGRWLAVAAGREVHLLDPDGARLWTSPRQASTIAAIAWTARGRLVTAGYGGVRIWDAPDGGLCRTLPWNGSLLSLAIRPDGRVIAGGGQDHSVHFWRLPGGQDSAITGHPTKPLALSFDAGGRYLATGGGPDVQIWCFDGKGPEGTTPQTLALHPGAIAALGFAHRGDRLASGCRDGGLIVWRVLPSVSRLVGGARGSARVEALVWSPDDRHLAVTDADGALRVFDVGP